MFDRRVTVHELAMARSLPVHGATEEGQQVAHGAGGLVLQDEPQAHNE